MQFTGTMHPKVSKAVVVCLLFVTSLTVAESKVVSNDKNEVSNANGTVVVVNIRNLNKTQYHNQNFRQGNYNYGYDIKPDGPLGQFHHENKAEDGVVYGCYGYIDPLDKPQITYYVSDSWGYRSLVQGQPLKVFYPKDHPEGTTEMKGNDLKWAQLQFPKQCDSLEDSILSANPRPILQAASAPITSRPTTPAPTSAPAPRPTPPAAAPASKKNDQTPLSVMLTFGPTASLDGVTGPVNNDNSGYNGPTSGAVKPAVRVESKQQASALPGQGAEYGGNAANKNKNGPVVQGYGEAPGNDAVQPQAKAQTGAPTNRPVSEGYGGLTPTATPESLRGSGGSSAERGGYGGQANRAPTQQPTALPGYNRVPANSVSSTNTRKEGPFSNVEHRITGSLTLPPEPASGSHRVPEISVHITQPNFDDGSKPYPQSAENDDDNYYAGGSNKNIIYPNSNENLSAYGSEESGSKPGAPRPPSTDYRPPSPTINYIQQTPKVTEQTPQYPSSESGSSDTQRRGENSRNPAGPAPQTSGSSGSRAPTTSFGIRTPDGQSYPSFDQLPSRAVSGSPNNQGTYPSPTVTYEDRPGPSGIRDGTNYDNRRDVPVQAGSQNQQQVPSGSGNGGCNGGCSQQQQPQPQDHQFIDYSQFPGAVVSNVPVIFYPDCRSNAFTRPAVVPFCPSLQPSAEPAAATPACSHRQPLTMRFPTDQSNTVYSNNYDLPSTRGAYPTNSFVTVGNRARAARRVVRRSRVHARHINNAKD